MYRCRAPSPPTSCTVCRARAPALRNTGSRSCLLGGRSTASCSAVTATMRSARAPAAQPRRPARILDTVLYLREATHALERLCARRRNEDGRVPQTTCCELIFHRSAVQCSYRSVSCRLSVCQRLKCAKTRAHDAATLARNTAIEKAPPNRSPVATSKKMCVGVAGVMRQRCVGLTC
jgi:hypothetical protein